MRQGYGNRDIIELEVEMNGTNTNGDYYPEIGFTIHANKEICDHDVSHQHLRLRLGCVDCNRMVYFTEGQALELPCSFERSDGSKHFHKWAWSLVQ